MNPYRYEANWTIEDHRDELILRLGLAIARIKKLEDAIRDHISAGKHVGPRSKKLREVIGEE